MNAFLLIFISIATSHATPFVWKESSTTQVSRRLSLCQQCIGIRTVVHVIEASTTPFINNTVDDEIEELNRDFQETPFFFDLINTTYTISNDWSNASQWNDAMAYDISAALRVGGPSVANIFITPAVCAVGGGMASIPYERGMFPPNTYTKGDFIFYCPTNFLQGVLAHEAGHWLGLFHIWQGGNTRNCEGPGDYVDDTPAKSVPSLLCEPNPLDTCSPGVDVSTNIMDYSGCMRDFTPGQMQRMWYIYNKYREIIEPCSEMTVEIQLQLGSNITDMELLYVEWGIENGYTLSLLPSIDEGIDLRNQTLSRQLCLPNNALHEIIFENPSPNTNILDVRVNG